jgi:endonuclease/exonuclease/phosphatase family metal-dependent hydrolase
MAPACARAAAGAVTAGDSLRVMTFNVLYEPALAGGGLSARWPLAVELLREADADVIGLQEVLPGRFEPLRRALPRHRLAVSEAASTNGQPTPFVWAVVAFAVVFVVLVGRMLRRRSRVLRLGALAMLLLGAIALVGNRLALVGSIAPPEEHLVLAYRPDRLRLVESGTLWLSTTPRKPGSHGPFDTSSHIALVTTFTRVGDGGPLTIVTAHVGHSPLERSRAARILRGAIDGPMHGDPRILLGDLNATPDNPLLRDLLAGGLRDAWTEAASRSGPATTYHWSRPQRDFFPLRIDYVLVQGAVRVVAASVVGKSRGNAVASDHDALIVDLALD